jgi:hypothetical protein
LVITLKTKKEHTYFDTKEKGDTPKQRAAALLRLTLLFKLLANLQINIFLKVSNPVLFYSRIIIYYSTHVYINLHFKFVMP